MPRSSQEKRETTEKVLATTLEELTPAATKSKGADRFHYFWQSGSPFSQWHKSKYELNGFIYTCAEQGMMHGKALLFEDYETAEKILKSSSPRSMKALGRKVRCFNDKVWRKHRENIVYVNSVAKFTQNPHLLEALMNTNGLLVEASPWDAIWGIGLAEANARSMSHKQWPGLLGKILTLVRDDIRAGTSEERLPSTADESDLTD